MILSEQPTCSKIPHPRPPRAPWLAEEGPPPTISIMPSRIEDYVTITDCQSVALVAKDGSLDWRCPPRFDSDSCFGALLGTRDNGCWKIRARRRGARKHRPGALVLETEFETAEGPQSRSST
jgi:GH15 family glucan-1,4-alpha-glucosidase